MAPAAAAAALLMASGWLAVPGIGYVVACLLATGVGVAAGWRWTPAPLGRPLVVTFAALVAFVFIAGRVELRLAKYARTPAEVVATRTAAQRERLRSAVDEELVRLRRIARRVLGVPASAPGDQVAVVSRLQKAIGDAGHRAALVLHGDTLLAWADTLHANPRALAGSSGIVATPFGLTLYVAEDSGGMRAVTTSLLFAERPADRLSRGLAQRLPSDELAEGFDIGAPSDSGGADVLKYMDRGRTIFVARALVPSPGEVRFRLLERARMRSGLALLISLVSFLVAVARREAGPLTALAGVLVALRSVAVVPLSEFSTRSRLFDAAVYFFPTGRAFTANAAALTITSATLLFVVLLAVRRVGSRMPRIAAAALATLTIGLGPFIVGALARGITPPAEGAGGALWTIWNVPLCLAATALLVLASWAGGIALGGRRGLPPAAGPAIALFAAVLAPLVWRAPGQWPQWYTALWTLAVGAVVLGRPSRRALLGASMVAGLGAITVVWGSTSRGRVELAERDVRGLSTPDAYAVTLANRLAQSIGRDEALPRSTQGLLARYLSSDLAASGYPVALISWQQSTPIATFGSAPFDVAFDTVGMAAVVAQAKGTRVVTTTRANVYGVHVVALPMQGGAMTILVAPRTRLIGNDTYARWYGLPPAENNEPPYVEQVAPDSLGPRESIRWRREGTELHGDWPVRGPAGAARAHVEVDLRGLDTLIPRGGLLLLIDFCAVGLIWLLGATADGRVARWLRLRRRRLRSYRARLSVALFLFFLVPAAAFAVWSWRQLSDDAQASRRLLVTETMRAVSHGDQPDWLRRESARLDTKLLLYQGGVLVDASDSLFADLAPMGALMRPEVALQLGVSGEVSATMPEELAGATGMLGYRVLPASAGPNLVIAAPARVDDLLLDRRRRDLGVLVLFATALGALAALWLSGIAARQLARPIAALRSAARSVARGERDLPLERDAASEFLPVFNAFRAMAADLGESRAALEEAQRRTDAVLRTVASGVVAVDEQGHVILANPRAELLLGAVPPAGAPVSEMPATAVAVRVARFLQSRQDFDGFELERAGRTLRGQITRLASEGAVLTLDDVTELARAQRVLAWGEMARQVAHEIKNPLTPIRLGVQHLRRARGRDDFDEILDQNVSRILTEIDRLDEIARAFSRYGGAPEERPPAEPTDVVEVIRDVVALETLGDGQVRWESSVEQGLPRALAREDELREVLLNLFENARLAESNTVRAVVRRAVTSDGIAAIAIEVTDDGHGIAADVLPKIFEPHFSTRTSGSGLGLAISRRMVESWGGEVTIESRVGVGTTVRVTLRAG
ncbi:MAG: ATP-binding protein [Gemmatimonadota bacterium]|nr:ATP-binding protein [Gemmatimonadota bacterium]